MGLPEPFRDLGLKVYRSADEVPYRILYLLGAGASGSVYAARKQTTSLLSSDFERVAIKCVGPLNPRDDHLMQVAREIKLLQRCSHPNILSFEEAYFVDSMELRNSVHIVTTPCASTTLFNFLQSVDAGQAEEFSWYQPQRLRPWPDVIEGLLKGVHYLHSQEPPIRHKDLKPENILLHLGRTCENTKTVRPIIADFGISKEHIVGQTTKNNATYRYYPFERFDESFNERRGDQCKPTLKEDIFSLGCCLLWIAALLHSGREGVVRVDELSLPFAPALSQIFQLLKPRELHPTSEEGRARVFQRLLLPRVEAMLAVTPADRCDIKTALGQFMDIRTRFNKEYDHRYVFIQMKIGRIDRLIQMNVSNIENDQHFFTSLRELLRKHHRQTRGMVAFSMALECSSALLQVPRRELFKIAEERETDDLELVPKYILRDYLRNPSYGSDHRFWVQRLVAAAEPSKFDHKDGEDAALLVRGLTLTEISMWETFINTTIPYRLAGLALMVYSLTTYPQAIWGALCNAVVPRWSQAFVDLRYLIFTVVIAGVLMILIPSDFTDSDFLFSN